VPPPSLLRLQLHRLFEVSNWEDASKRHIPVFGAIGELGSLVSELKKSLRDGKAYTEGEENLLEEFGDVLWYLSALSSHYGFDLKSLIAKTKPSKFEKGAFGHIYAMVRAIPLLTEEFESLPTAPTEAQKQKLGKRIAAAGQATLQALKAHGLNLSTVLSAN